MHQTPKASTLILTARDIKELADMEMALEAVEGAFSAHALGATQMPSKVYLSLPEYDGDFRAMPALACNKAAVKWVNSHPQNMARNALPAVMGMLILSDPETAFPLALMDATLITALRTGAAAGVATRWLFLRRQAQKSDLPSVGFIGCGVQARHLWKAHQLVLEQFVAKVSDRNPAMAQQFAAEIGGQVVSTEEAAGCDVLCVATPSRTPVVFREWIRDGAHINAMGADAKGKQELESVILNQAAVFVDDRAQAAGSGEVNVPLSSEDGPRPNIVGTLGEVIAGRLSAPSSAEALTVFDSTGLAVQDVALAARIYEAAVAAKVGLPVNFVDP